MNSRASKEKRQRLRNDSPLAEQLLWRHLRGRGLKNHKFRRQHSVGPYILDFYCTSACLSIEIDGDSHFHPKAKVYDKQRQEYIEKFGIMILRFTNNNIYFQLEEVLKTIIEHLPDRR